MGIVGVTGCTDALPLPMKALIRSIGSGTGLYILGLLWQHSQASATLLGPMLDAPHLVAYLRIGVTG